MGAADDSAETWGATSGCWCWEWDVRRAASGDVAVGVVAAGFDPAAPLGSDERGCAYRSCGAVARCGEVRGAAPFAAGDVLSVDLDIRDDRADVRFFKNGVEVALGKGSPFTASLVPPRAGPRGFRPACHVGGAGDAVVFLGAKRGFGKRTYAVDVEGSDGTLSYEGDWGTARGCRDGYGRIAFDHCAGCWVGPFVGDRPHGVVLWVEPCDDGADVTGHCDGDEVVAPVLFDRGERVRALDDAEAAEATAAYFARKRRRGGLWGAAPRRRPPRPGDGADDRGSDSDGESGESSWTLRVVYRDGATARRGVEIDASEVVRRVAVGEEQGRKRERNSQLQRLRSRPFPTRFG